MKHLLQKIILALFIVHNQHAVAISVVYNFRIAQITKQPIVDQSNRKHSIIALAFDIYQKKYTQDIQQKFCWYACSLPV